MAKTLTEAHIANFQEWFTHRNDFEKKSIIVVSKAAFPQCYDLASAADDVAFISITASPECATYFFNDMEESSHYAGDSDRVLNLNFDDVTEDLINTDSNGFIYKYYAISPKQADQVYMFVKKNLDKHIVVHCRAGKSRSAGVAFALFALFPDVYEENVYNSVNPIVTPNYDVVAKIKRVGYIGTMEKN